MRIAAIIATLALAACSSEPTFVERYESAQDQIADKAEALDEELSGEPAITPENEGEGAE